MVPPREPDRLARLVRYPARPPVAMGRVSRTPDGRARVCSPSQTRTAGSEVPLDPPERNTGNFRRVGGLRLLQPEDVLG